MTTVELIRSQLATIALVLIHPGPAHRDDFLSYGLLCAITGDLLPVERREPTDDELADPAVWCVDVGGSHDTTLHNFDHHQYKGGLCALHLLAKFFGICDDLQRLSWFDITNTIDTMGPFATAKEAGWGSFPFELMSPVESAMFHLMEDGPSSIKWKGIAMITMQEALLSAARLVERLAWLEDNVSVETINNVRGIIVPSDDNFAIDEFRAENCPDAGWSISFDNRGPGYALFRFEDHPRVNFSLIKDSTVVSFAHKGGFIAKTINRENLALASVKALVALSITD